MTIDMQKNEYKFDILTFAAIVYLFCIVFWDTTIFYQIALVFLGMVCLLIKRGSIRITPFTIMYGSLILFFLIHTLLGFSVAPEISYRTIATLVINLFSVIFLISVFDSKERIHTIMKAYIYITFIVCIYIIIIDFNNLLSGSLGFGADRLFADSHFGRNSVALPCIISILFILYFLKSKMKSSYMLIPFFCAFVFLTGARRSIIFLFFSLVIYLFIFSSKTSLLKRVLNLLFFCVALSLVVFIILRVDTLYQMIGYRIEGVFQGIFLQTDLGDSSFRSREIMRQTGSELFRDHPFRGHGLDTFRTFPGSFGTWSHNNYIELAISGGIFSVLIFYSYHLKSLFSLWTRGKDHLGMMLFTFILYLFINDFMAVSYFARSFLFMFALTDAYLQGSMRVTSQKTKYGENHMKLSP